MGVGGGGFVCIMEGGRRGRGRVWDRRGRAMGRGGEGG